MEGVHWVGDRVYDCTASNSGSTACFFNSQKTMEDTDSRSSSDKEEEVSVIL